MWRIRLNHKGISMVEALMAILLTTIAVVALMPMQDVASKTVLKSDYLGRAQGILQAKLEQQELTIMNSSNTISAGTSTESVTVSGLSSSVSGDMTFTVVTKISAYSSSSATWLVNVKVTWTGNVTGISSSMIVTRQTGFTSS